MTECKKKWVFIFDQVDKVLSKKGVTRLSQLRFPESQIKHIMKPKKILSIISASASNQATMLHEGFQAFQHELQMSRDEIRLAFPSLASNEEVFEKYCDITGRVPLQKMSKLVAAGFDKESYEQEAKRDVLLSLATLHNEAFASTIKHFMASALSCVFRAAIGDGVFYDRKYLVRDNTVAGGQYQYKAAFPAVLLAYYDYYFDQIMANLNEIHYSTATIWNTGDMCGAEREWLFERAIIATCKRNGTIDHVANHSNASIPESLNVSFQKVFDLPPNSMANDGMYVPRYCCFPAIDFIWKQGNIVVAVQAHASANQTLVLTSFEAMLTNQNSWGEFEKVFLLYLSPDEATATQMREKVDKDKPSGNHPNLIVAVASLSDFTCLRDILRVGPR